MIKRPSGGRAFYVLQDGAGRIQLMAQRDILGEADFERFHELIRVRGSNSSCETPL